MVEIEEVHEDEEVEEVEEETPSKVLIEEIPMSEERMMDAKAIEAVLPNVTRPTARMHLEALAKKLRKESEALKRVEESRAKMEGEQQQKRKEQTAAVASNGTGESKGGASSTTTTTTTSPIPTGIPETPPPKPVAIPPTKPTARYSSIDRFSFDAGKYNSSHVSVYVPLPGVGSIDRGNVTCDFTPTSFDLVVRHLDGRSYRLNKSNLSNDIVPDASKHVVKADKVIVKLAKVKSDYGSYDHWSDLEDKKKIRKKDGKEDPSASIMNLMKDMYDSGDDNMKRMIGETMEKQRRGELGRDSMGGMGDMGGMGF